MSDFLEDVYTYQGIIRKIAGTAAQKATTAAAVPANSVVRYNSSNLLVQAFNTAGNFSKIAGVTILGAASGSVCTFYPNGSVVALSGLNPGQAYYLDVDGSLTTTPAPLGVTASIKIGTAVTTQSLALEIIIFYL